MLSNEPKQEDEVSEEYGSQKESSQDEMIPEVYETQIQKLEAEVRTFIKYGKQLKLHQDILEEERDLLLDDRDNYITKMERTRLDEDEADLLVKLQNQTWSDDDYLEVPEIKSTRHRGSKYVKRLKFKKSRSLSLDNTESSAHSSDPSFHSEYDLDLA